MGHMTSGDCCILEVPVGVMVTPDGEIPESLEGSVPSGVEIPKELEGSVIPDGEIPEGVSVRPEGGVPEIVDVSVSVDISPEGGSVIVAREGTC